MKTFDVKHSDIVNFENILEADKNASQCKHYRDENLKFSAHREEGIIDLLNRLTYYPVFDEEGNQIPGKTESSYNFPEERLHLELNNKTSIRPAWLPVTFVGAQISPKFIRMRKSTRKRMFRRIKFIKKLFEACEIGFQKLNNTMQSYFGLIQHFTAGNLLRKIIDEFSFRIRNNS